MGEHRLFLNSDGSHFTVQLAKPIILTDHWELGLNEIDITSTLDTPCEIYICSDICSDSFVGSSLLPVLRRVNFKKNFRKIYVDPYFSKVTRQYIQDIKIFIYCDNKKVLDSIQHVSLVLTLKWRMSM